jgi:hypothetical protein
MGIISIKISMWDFQENNDINTKGPNVKCPFAKFHTTSVLWTESLNFCL